LAKGTKATKGYEVYVVSFSFTAPYSGNAQVFMSDLEQSLTLFDVESIDISLTNENNLLYSLLLNTYAMK